MRLTLLLVLLSVALPATAEIYKWTDPQGRVHYSDKPPVSGAELLNLPDASAPPAAEAEDPADADDPAIASKPKAAQGTVLAECLARSGAKLYGASWCGQCRKQLKMFGEAAGRLPYVECSVDGTRASGDTTHCDRQGIRGYPTWVMPNGSRRAGVVDMTALARMSGCSI